MKTKKFLGIGLLTLALLAAVFASIPQSADASYVSLGRHGITVSNWGWGGGWGGWGGWNNGWGWNNWNRCGWGGGCGLYGGWNRCGLGNCW